LEEYPQLAGVTGDYGTGQDEAFYGPSDSSALYSHVYMNTVQLAGYADYGIPDNLQPRRVEANVLESLGEGGILVTATIDGGEVLQGDVIADKAKADAVKAGDKAELKISPSAFESGDKSVDAAPEAEVLIGEVGPPKCAKIFAGDRPCSRGEADDQAAAEETVMLYKGLHGSAFGGQHFGGNKGSEFAFGRPD
uniref:Uncharacterized protein n=1 Tax=Panagrolaimus sp. PS1159 TaxID=55785 RepID=A0AC35GKY7_9BILA